MMFINEYAKELYDFIINVNNEIMEDRNQNQFMSLK